MTIPNKIPSNTSIRHAVADDAVAIASVYLESLFAAYSQNASEAYLATRNLADCTEQWSYNISDKNVTVIVADCDGVISGLASFGAARDEDVGVVKSGDSSQSLAGEIQAIYVSPQSWGQGIGGQLCRYAMNELYAGRNTCVVLWVLVDNARAVRFYERAGFVRDSASKTVSMGNQLQAVRYKHSRSKD